MTDPRPRPHADTRAHPPARSRVALIRGNDRYRNISQALDAIAASLDLSGCQQVLIKPNFVVTHEPQAATHVDAVRAVLDFLRARYQGRIVIAEGPAFQPAAEGFENYGYRPLAARYGVELRDLNHDSPAAVTVYDWRLRPLSLHLARSVLESDFRISVSPPKTHDVVIVTLSLKNMIMGSLISRLTHAPPPDESRQGAPLSLPRPGMDRITKLFWRLIPEWIRHLPPAEWLRFRAMSHLEPSDKMKMHQSYPVINLNLALLAPLVVPHLAVIDGQEAMEGNGPTEGSVVPLGLAIASSDALAADVVGTTVMGFDAEEVGYLHYCKRMQLGVGDLSQIEIVGNADLAECIHPFRPHDTYDRQRHWQLPGVEDYLRQPGAGAGTGPHAQTAPEKSP